MMICQRCHVPLASESEARRHLSTEHPELLQPYAELRRVLDLALEQASTGKGKERHAIEGERFEDQQIVQLGVWMGSHHFEVGQACKKLLESTRLKPGAGKREILGAINYAVAAYLLLERQGED